MAPKPYGFEIRFEGEKLWETKTVRFLEQTIIYLNSAQVFFGAYQNLLFLEEKIEKNGRLTVWQYPNYLNQIALRVELGMKTIIGNEYDGNKTHDLKELFGLMPDVFHGMVEMLVSVNKNIMEKSIEDYLEKVKNIFDEFRYFELNNFDDSFTDEHILDSENKIIFQK